MRSYEIKQIWQPIVRFISLCIILLYGLIKDIVGCDDYDDS